MAESARDLAEVLLAGLPERWRHTIGVAERARQVSAAVRPAEADLLEAAAWLHDIGYAAELYDTGFHPVDGARHLRSASWPARICGLVAHHSEALCVAHARGLADAVAAFPREQSAVSDALTYADQTVGPNGRSMSIDQRLADMLRRHGADSPNGAVHALRAPLIRQAVSRVDRRLTASRLVSAA